MASYFFSVDGAETGTVGPGEPAVVNNIAFFDTTDTVTGTPGSSTLDFNPPGAFSLNLTGYPGITGFSTLFLQHANGGISIVIGQDFYDGNNFNGLMTFLAASLSGDSIVLDASALNGASDVNLQSYSGNDMLTGGAGTDNLVGAAGADQLDGGAGIDLVRYDFSPAGVTVALITGIGTGSDAQGDSYSNIEGAVGSTFADTLVGNAGTNYLIGSGGDDDLAGLDGADALIGNSGSDRAIYAASAAAVTVDLALGTGIGGDAEGDTLATIENLVGSFLNDRLYGDGNANTLFGHLGNDILRGGAGADSLDGSDGSDFASYQGSAAGITVNLLAGTASGGDAQGDTLANIESVIGSALVDGIVGDTGDNSLGGGAGNDNLEGGGGNDLLSGGFGVDSLTGGAGNDVYDIDDAGDSIVEDSGGGTDLVRSTAVSFTLAANVENAVLLGSADNDLAGNGLGNRLHGNGGANSLSGGGGTDVLSGLVGDDSLEGGLGIDYLWGGIGADSFVFRESEVAWTNVDRIADFGLDDVISFDVSSGPTGTLDAGAFVVGANALDADDRFVYYAPTGGLYFDADGAGGAQKVLLAVLNNQFTLTAADIVLI